MKIVNVGDTYQIYSDDLKTYDQLPPGTYKISFHPMAGFSLVQMPNFQSVEEKIYGNHNERIEKVLTSYEQFNRSLGVILSGEKGMGKSLFVQLLAEAAIQIGLPVIMVTKAYKGIADFIEKIDQEALVIFDEFEKVFSNRRGQMGQNEPAESQEDLLGLFDGISQQKRLYAVTVNHLHQVNEFMVSRTGRFHYHIRFDYPSADEIDIYLKDKVKEEHYPEIKHVIAFASRVRLNYDSLRAIAFELNAGYSFQSAIADLNILTVDAQRYDVRINFSNGKVIDLKDQNLNLFGDSIQLNAYPENGEWLSIDFDPRNIQNELTGMVVDGEDIRLHTDEDNRVFTNEIHVTSLSIKQHKEMGVNYRLAL